MAIYVYFFPSSPPFLNHSSCDTSDPKGCQRRRHRKEHHNEYPYSKKLEYVSSIMQYTNMRTIWFQLEEENYSGDAIKAVVGLAHKGKVDGSLLIHLGGWYSEYFRTIDKEDFDLERLSAHSGK